MKALALFLLAATMFGPAALGPRTEPPDVIPNDNRHAAGQLRGDTLELSLVLDLATWRPEGPDGPSAVVPALAEAGKAPEVPAPVIRVPLLPGDVHDLDGLTAVADHLLAASR